MTGLGALTPLGKTVTEYWDGLSRGVSGAAPITRFDASKFKTRFACEIKGYNPDDYFERFVPTVAALDLDRLIRVGHVRHVGLRAPL